jgi:hypothetical protein
MNPELINETFTEEKKEEELFEVNVKFNLGRLKISPFTSPNLYQLEAIYPNENYTPSIKYIPGKRGELWLESQKIGSSLTSTFSIDKVLDLFSKDKREDTISSSSNSWDLKLTKDIPIELTIKGGAADQDIELGGLMLKYLKLNTGASVTNISFVEANEERLEMKIDTGAASFEAKGLGYANIDELKFDGGVGKSTLNFEGELKDNSIIEIGGGLGLIVIELPKDTGTVIRAKNSRLLNINSLPKSFTEKGDVYVNDAFDESKPHLNISINVALGSLRIVEI